MHPTKLSWIRATTLHDVLASQKVPNITRNNIRLFIAKHTNQLTKFKDFFQNLDKGIINKDALDWITNTLSQPKTRAGKSTTKRRSTTTNRDPLTKPKSGWAITSETPTLLILTDIIALCAKHKIDFATLKKSLELVETLQISS